MRVTYSNGVRTATEFIASCRAAGFSPAIVQEGSGIGRVGSRQQIAPTPPCPDS